MTTTLFLFHRDLRLQDNTALIAALKSHDQVIPVFVFERAQVGNNNEYKSTNAVQFMIESLQELDGELKEKGSKLYTFYGESETVIKKVLKAKKDIVAVYSHFDYTPFAQARDKKLASVCKQGNVSWIQMHDYVLNPPEAVLKDNGEPYTVFTPYMKKARLVNVRKPQRNTHSNYFGGNLADTVSLADIKKKLVPKPNKELFTHGGREEARKLLNRLDHLKQYKTDRDFPAKQATTGLSAHHKFGTVSLRETYYKVVGTLGITSTLINELYWHDFYTQVAFHFPNVFGKSFQEKYRKVTWRNNKKEFDAWCEGKTGFPIVDAGMRQLVTTGYMHNRVRMIVASFLTKDLLIDWRWGEKFFAQHLTDYDPAVNNGSWQWAASTGTDAQPYFRIFNPWLQQQKFDTDCEYIKRWVPELETVSAKNIHNWYKEQIHGVTYPEPIVDHKDRSAQAKAAFKAAS